MKLTVLAVLALIVVATNANFVNRECKCKAVSDTMHVPFHSWEASSCKFCSCNNAAMTNCEASCKSFVENYAKSGCGKLTKGSKILYLFEASNCKKGYGTDVFTCA